MKHSLVRVYRALVCGALLAACHLACPVAGAQQRDEAWVIAQITAGKFEELRALEKPSDEGVPFAMYWWGSLMDRCVFDRCNQQAAREFFVRAAKAGHSRAQAHRCPPLCRQLKPSAVECFAECATELFPRIGLPKHFDLSRGLVS